MKKIFTFLFLMGIITSGFAQWQGGDRGGDRGPKYDNRNDNFKSSSVVIKAFTERRFTVMIDNMPYQLNEGREGKRYDNAINVGAMSLGKHSITVYETRSGFWGKQKQKEVYCSFMFLKPGFETYLTVNNYGQVSLSERKQFQNYGYGDKRRDDDRRH